MRDYSRRILWSNGILHRHRVVGKRLHVSAVQQDLECGISRLRGNPNRLPLIADSGVFNRLMIYNLLRQNCAQRHCRRTILEKKGETDEYP